MAIRVRHQLVCVYFLLISTGALAQDPCKGLESLFTIPKGYIVNYVKMAPQIDGNINDAVWKQAKWTSDFVDIEGNMKPKPGLQTNVKMLWDDSYLYIAARIYEPNVWANLKRHDDIVFRDNDFEVFLNPNNSTHQYFELEFNALNTVFDLFLNKPYRNGGNAMINWNAEGLRSAVEVLGTINNPSDTDNGWTIEMAIPFRSISLGNNVQVPKEGTLWRINFSRVEWDTKVVDGKYVKLKDATGRSLPEHNWVWSPQGIVNMHYPERWGYLQFSKSNDISTFGLPYEEMQKRCLWLVCYREKRWFEEHGAYTSSLKDLVIDDKARLEKITNTLQLEATTHQFIALIKGEKSDVTQTINQDGR